jgi:hypothetical protein
VFSCFLFSCAFALVFSQMMMKVVCLCIE